MWRNSPLEYHFFERNRIRNIGRCMRMATNPVPSLSAHRHLVLLLHATKRSLCLLGAYRGSRTTKRRRDVRGARSRHGRSQGRGGDDAVWTLAPTKNRLEGAFPPALVIRGHACRFLNVRVRRGRFGRGRGGLCLGCDGRWRLDGGQGHRRSPNGRRLQWLKGRSCGSSRLRGGPTRSQCRRDEELARRRWETLVERGTIGRCTRYGMRHSCW